ncbi:phage portal protein [Streptomyces rectiverticillatus]|uniref:phage portal protein n=1 Tax=Streptomyces rectiverticillatus TaxID=173860 RepID=UPI0015C3FA78|nr:phage portal protein [Streptomyces rectiverticillatus]QLE71103.1 phage portal protein [Streptomyces rectiverticillatus]
MIVPPGGYTVIGPPETPLDWLAYLYGKLTQRRPELLRYADYYEGEHQRLAFSQARYREEFREVFERWRDNFCALIIDSAAERLVVDGFRTPEGPGTDADAREFWQRSSMDAFSNAVHLDAMIQGQAYVLVWANAKQEPIITPVSAEEMVVQYAPGSRTDLEAAARFYQDDWGRQWVTLWTPAYVYETKLGKTAWEDGTRRPNPLKTVPVVPFNNRARLVGHPYSDLSNVIPLQDAINKTASDALTASEFAAFPQRYVTGLEIQEDEHGNPREPFRVAVDKLLQAEDPQASFGSFAAADLGNYVTLISMLVQHMAAISRTPHSYFLVNGGAGISGEGLMAAESGLVAKVRERIVHFGEAWERVLRLCFAVQGDPRKDAYSMETIWRDPEHRTESQHIDALLKLKQLSVPEEQLWTDAGYSSTQVANFRAMRKEDAKAAAEIQQLGPQSLQATQPPSDKTAARLAAKAPQGNSGNVNRKLNEDQ